MKFISVLVGILTGIIVSFAVLAQDEISNQSNKVIIDGSTHEPENILIRNVVNVADEVIYLGDLFENVSYDVANKIIAYAPKPGRQVSYGAQWLYKVAQYYQLDWRPKSSRDIVIVRRESFVIERDQIEEAIMESLIDKGIDPQSMVELSNRNIRIFLPSLETPDIQITDLYYDERTERFTATISAPANSPQAQHYRINGRVYGLIDIPVLVGHVTAGEIISANDLKWQRTRANKIIRDTAMNMSDLVGMAPKRGLRPDTPIRLSEIAAPLVVAKKSQIILIYQHNNMTLTVQGLALQSGAVGEVIRVSNAQSKTIVDAKVVASGQAIVRSIELLAMN